MGLFSDLRNTGVYSGYDQFVRQLEPVLQDMSTRGLPVDPARFADVHAELTARKAAAESAMQSLVPDEVRACQPKMGYKKEPKDAVLGADAGDGKKWGRRYFPMSSSNPLEGAVQEERWVKLLPWKPSHDGIARYAKYKNHKMPANWKTGKTTTNQIELTRMAARTRDVLYDAILEYRDIATVLDNHMKNWEPTADGRVHPTFYYDTGTGQLATRRPNVQNAPKHKISTGPLFRSMIVARPGHTLLEFDYRSFHAQTLAFEAQDADYLRLAKLDIHSYLAAYLVKYPDRDKLLGLANNELRERLGDIRKKWPDIRDQKAKRVVLGYGFGMGYKRLYNMNQESFDNQADAKRVIDTMNGLFPVANAWRDSIRKKAHEQGYLLSRSGCVRWFWEVFKWSGGQWANGGDDSEAAVAFLPANDAFCHIKYAMLRLEQADWLRRANLVNQIHDSLMFECPDELIDEAITAIRTDMERPSDVLIDPVVAPGGLSVEVGVSRGKSWNKMEKI